jgi:hypothetical protein
MTTTHLVIVSNGFWYSGYEPYDMLGTFCSTRYAVSPMDGGAALTDGHYKGFVVRDGVLRIVRGGEYLQGTLINQDCWDFSIAFDEDYHNDYRAGVERGYKGKRACSYNHLCKHSLTWRDGYQEGVNARKNAKLAA